MVMSLRHLLPVFLFILVGLNLKAQCPPTVFATPATANVCAGDSVLMESTPSTGTTWQWYKDGISIPGATNSTCYAYDAGNFTVKTGGCASASNPVSVTIRPLPILSISSSSPIICFNEPVSLSVTTSPNVLWAWIDPPSIFGTNTNPLNVTLIHTQTFQLVGADQITQCANTTAVTVLVLPELTTGTISPNSQVCPGGTPSLITSTLPMGSSGIYTYQWQRSTTSSSSGFSNIIGATGLTYQPGPTVVTTWYRILVSSPPCDDKYTNVVVVQVNPNPNVTSSPNKAICTGDNVNYTPTSDVTGATFTWTATVTSGTVSGFTASGSGNIHDILSLPFASSTSGEVTYVITPYGPAPSNCAGTSFNLVVTVNPIPYVTNAVLSQSICAGTATTPVVLQSNIASATFSWTATGTAGLSGYLASGTGNIPAMTITSLLSVSGTVTYTITPHGPGAICQTGPSVSYVFTVNPSPGVTNNPMQQDICTGNATNAVILSSNVPAPTFTWTATALPATISGFLANGTNTIPVQTITNLSNIQGKVTYHIIPNVSLNGCAGIPNDYVVNINPEPVASSPQLFYTVCSGTSTNIPLSSTVAGTTFNWTASAPGVITGYSDGTGNLIAQTLDNGSNADHDVKYVITPTSNGCAGNPITITVTVTPAQVLTVVPAAPTTCSGNNVVINLIGNVPSITFTWTASTTGNVTGFSDGSGSIISQTLTNHDNVTRTVNYAVIMTLNGCSSGVTNFTVTVYPETSVTISPLSSEKCSGDVFNLALTSSVAGSTYSWTANSIPGISGYSDGNGNTINQTIFNNTTAPASVIYSITPTANGCPGTPVNYDLTINPIPIVTLSLANQSICSGTSTVPVNFSSTVAGTTYSWTATPSGPGISGYLASGSVLIPSQTINSTLSTQGTVTYAVTPSFNGCTGNIDSHIATINPLPRVSNSLLSQSICSGTSSANVNLLSNVAGTSFTWTAAPSSPAITGYMGSGGNNIPSQTIFNSTLVPGSVTYHITPTSNFTPSCAGTTSDYIINVNAAPSITSSLIGVVCSGQPLNYNITGNLAGATFTWSRAAVTGISNPTGSASSAVINETLFNTTNTDIDVLYILTPIGLAPTFCSGVPQTLTVKVRSLPLVNAGLDQTISYGVYTNLNGSASGGTGALNYTWTPNSYISSGAGTLTPQTTNLISNRTYTLAVNDATGCTANDQMTVFVTGTPVAAAPTATPSTVCVGASSIINANATGGSGTYTYSWTSVPAGYTSTAPSITVSPLVNTTYFVTVNDGFNTTSGSVSVTVNPLPLQFGLTGGGSYCSGGTGVVVGLAGSQSGVNYQLYNNGNPVGMPVSGTGTSISFGTQTLAGIYSATATRASTSCTQGMGSIVSVSINALPVANAGADQVIPFGTSTTLYGSVSGGSGTINYSWSPSALIAAGGNTSSPFTVNLYSNTTFTLNVTDSKGCKGTDQVAVSLAGNAINVTTSAVPAQICADLSTTQLNSSATGGSGTYTYSWTCNPAGSPAWTSTQQNPIVSPDVNTIYTVTANDGFNTAIASVTIGVNPLPAQYSVTGGGIYCYAGSGTVIGLSGSELNINYQLLRGGVADGPAVTGTGNPISFGNRTAAFTYTVAATNNITGCTNLMNGNATILIIPPPSAYLVTGGGSYPLGGQGREIGLMHSDNGISYQLYCNNIPVGTPISGNESSLNFGFQTQPGTYTIVATDSATGCTNNMTGSVDISILPLPNQFDVTGGGAICQDEPGLPVGLSGSEAGVNYQLLYNGFPLGPIVAGTNLPLSWGPFSNAGLYEVRGFNSVSGASQMMQDSAVITINPMPTIFTVDPTGSQCPGTIIRLNGSDAGFTYYLQMNGISIDTLAGTGTIGFLNFGPQTMNGTYMIRAENILTGCNAMMNGSTYISIAPQVYNVIPAGILCPGQDISLTGSETGVNYQLRWNGTFDLGTPIPGTGSGISLGNAGLPGLYSAVAIDATTNCASYMNDSATLYPDPTAFTMVPDGDACEGNVIGLNGSENGVDYVLLLENAIHIDTVSGTGLPINFGAQLTAGNYTVIAINQTSYCQFNMNGTTSVKESPIKYHILPAGLQCIGSTISLSGSQAGVTYQLMLDGLYNIGLPVSGTGNSISFGAQSLNGIYTVRAINDLTGCNSIMADSTILEPLPIAFTTIPAGNHCAGTSVGLNGSQVNYNYILVLDGAINLDTIPGTGNAIDFGGQTTAGSYSVVAYNNASFCSSPMNGNSIIEPAPVAFAMTPAGILCIASEIGLDNSEAGVIYQLRRDGITNIGPAVAGTGSSISFGTMNIPGQYSVIATSALNGCVSVMDGNATLNPLPLVYLLTPQGEQCAGTSINLNGSQIGTDYVLLLDNSYALDTISGTGNVLDFGPQFVTGAYTIEAIGGATTCQSMMAGSALFLALPTTFNITPAGLFCTSAPIGLDGSETGINYTLFNNGISTGVTIAGTGNAISFGTQLNGNYSILAVNQITNCSIFMPGTIQVSNPPIVHAGSDATICAEQNAMFNATVILGGTTTWSTSGDGAFNNVNLLNAVYTPGANDKASGKVSLFLTADGAGSCSAIKVTDTLTLTINQPTAANAGVDIEVCAASDYTISEASATNFTFLNWTATGTGTIVNRNTLTPTYVPSEDDITAGSINLILHVTGNSPCSNSATDTLTMIFHPIVTVDAGPGAIICNSCKFTANTASVQNSSLVQWSSSGSGTFEDASIVNATYTPSMVDIVKGSVILTLTAFNNPPCAFVADTLTLHLLSDWGVDFKWAPSCEAKPVTFSVDPAITNIGAISEWLWEFGDGSTSDQMNPTHLFPGLGDFDVKLSATDTSGNVYVVSHFITITQFPVSFFSYSTPNCSNEPMQFTDLSHTLYGYIAEWVWNYGDGTVNDTIRFPDEPNLSHLYNSPGKYNVTLSIINSFGCITATTIQVEAIEAPIANFQYTDNCSGLETSFRDASFANGPGNTVQYWWDFGNPSTGSDNYSDKSDATHIFSAPGTYQVMHIVRNFNNCTDTIVKPVVILTPVPVDFVHDHTCVDGKANFGPDTTVMNVTNISSWKWDFGDGVTNDQQVTTHIYAGPGNYQVTLTVIDISGCTASKTRTVTVNPLPVAMFNTTQLPCVYEPVHFDDISNTYEGFITKWNWDFGDGSTRQIFFPANPDTEHTYLTPGTYTVKLTIYSSDSCSAERQETIVINPAPAADFDYTNTCQRSTAQFTDLTQPGSAGSLNGWNWNFGDELSGSDNRSSLQNPTHIYSVSGTYQVTLSVSSANGCSSTVAKQLIVTDAPFVDFSYDNRCAATNIQFTPASAVITADVATWNWSFGDGSTSSEPNPQHSYPTAGNYIVALTISTTTGCQNTISHSIIILPAPVAKFITIAPTCSLYQVSFIDQSSAPTGLIVSWEYDFGDGTSAIINYPENPNVSHTYAIPGTYIATLTVIADNGCQAHTSQSITIFPSPAAKFEYDASCLGTPVHFNDLSQSNLVSWSWNFGDTDSGASNTSNQQNPAHTFLRKGNYLVTLLVRNANGCHDIITSTLSISAKPAVDFSFTNNCTSDTIHFNSSAFVNIDSTSSWLWNFGDNSTSVDADPNHIYYTPGTYTVSLTITSQNGCTNSETHQVQVSAAPIALFTPTFTSCSGTAVLFTDISSTINGIIESWNWNFGDGTIVSVDSPSSKTVKHTYSSAGIYKVILTIHTSAGCYASYNKTINVGYAPAASFSYVNSCNDSPTLFTDHTESTGGNMIVGWNWDFGDPASGISNHAILQNPQHIFSTPGVFSVTLTTENSAGCISSITQTVTIEPEQTLNFMESSSCNGTPVKFNVDPTFIGYTEITSYLWDFGDGSTASTLPEPHHLYSHAGNYNVTLTITKLSGCKISISHVVTIHILPLAQFTTSGNCATNEIGFTDTSFSPDGDKIVSWAWDFGVNNLTNDTSTKQNPTFIFEAEGTYNVSLTITTASGCTALKIMPVVVVFAAPTAHFSYVAEPCHNGSVLFIDESESNQSAITGWKWEFTPGIYSSLQNPVHVFGDTDTCYNVKLTVTTANGCTSTFIQKVCIPTGIKVAMNYTQSCKGETTWFTSSLVQPEGGAIASYYWNFGDPSTAFNNESRIANPQHSFSQAGTFIVSLQVTDNSNCSTTRYMSVTVDPLPKADFSYSGGVCDSLVKFNNVNTGTKIVRWIWNFGDGNSRTVEYPENPNVNHYYSYPGQYEVKLITQSEAGCSDTILKPVRRIPCIAAAFTAKNPVACQKSSMKFAEASTCQAPIASWQWFFGDNTSVTFTSPQAVVEHTYSTAGNYTVKMVVATEMVGGMATDTASTQVAVQPAAKAAYAWQDACIGNSTTFENQTQSNNTTIKSYVWDFGDISSASKNTSAVNPDHKYSLSGEYNVKLVVTNTLGCTDTVVKKINIFASPSVDFTWNNNCEAKPVFFTGITDASPSSTVNWNWKFSSAGEVLDASNKPNCSISFAHAGNYDADLKVTDLNGCSTTITKQIKIEPSPIAAFNIQENYENTAGQVLFSNGTINGTEYEWDFGNGKTSSAPDPVITFDKEGHYTIQLIAWNGPGCTDTMTMKYELMYKGLFVPNAFSPGHMDPEVAVFKPKGTNLKSYYCEIFDRWGNLLWSSSKIDSKGSPAESWDGKLHGELMKQDVYLWKISAQFNDDEVWDGKNAGNNENMPQKKTGTVTLIR